MLQKGTVSASTLALIKLLMKDEKIQDFYLAGGTALALQLGHRKSIDIDLFIGSGFNNNALCNHLKEEHKFEITYLGENTILGFIGDVKVDLIAHKYPMARKDSFCVHKPSVHSAGSFYLSQKLSKFFK